MVSTDLRRSLIYSVVLSLFIGLFLCWNVLPARSDGLPIIPKPAESSLQEGVFQLTDDTLIYYSAGLKTESRMLQASIEQDAHFTLLLVALPGEGIPRAAGNYIRLSLSSNQDTGPEGYRLAVAPNEITIAASSSAGVYWGIQSLRQLIIPKNRQLPACTIQDQPRFSWRGMMLDVGRYMYGVEDIKQLLDWMALHKLNTLHWHLTEDQGWRIEIKKYPKLTEVGAWRDSSPTPGDRNVSDGTRYGGFYNQAEIRDLVEYAAQRHIQIVPEIDMPGHMAAAIASYPELGNDDIADYAPSVASSWGVRPYILAPKEETFQWIDDVLAEICELFPSKYIHIGGDEAPKDQWQESAFAQSIIKREGLKNEHELQSWFIKRVEQILEEKGRRLIGWNEIREGGLSPGATVMAWQTWESAVESAREGHDVILAPKSHTYFDYYQASAKLELAKGLKYEAIGGYLPLVKVYDFDPLPSELVGTEAARHVLGCQGQIWSEHIRDWDKAEYMTFPRLSALAEAAWSSPQQKDYDNFLQRLRPMLARYDAAGVHYFDPFQQFSIETRWDVKIETTLPCDSQSAAEFAFDGNWQTYFVAARSPEPSDHFTLTFKSPIRGTPIRVFTGSSPFGSRERKWGGQEDALQNGVLESSTDGVEWQEIATFEAGQASGFIPDKCQSVRIRATANQPAKRLVIHEIQLGKK